MVLWAGRISTYTRSAVSNCAACLLRGGTLALCLCLLVRECALFRPLAWEGRWLTTLSSRHSTPTIFYRTVPTMVLVPRCGVESRPPACLTRPSRQSLGRVRTPRAFIRHCCSISVVVCRTLLTLLFPTATNPRPPAVRVQRAHRGAVDGLQGRAVGVPRGR